MHSERCPMAGGMIAGCADDPYPGRQRPTYSYESVDRGPQQSGQQYRFDERPPASDPYSESYRQAWALRRVT